MRTTKDIRKAVATATTALAKGNNDAARRAVAYALSATGLRARLSRPVTNDSAILATALEVLGLELARREAANQAARSLFAR